MKLYVQRRRFGRSGDVSFAAAMSDEPEAPPTSRCVVTTTTRVERSAFGKEIVTFRFDACWLAHLRQSSRADEFLPAQTTIKILSKDKPKIHRSNT